MLVSSIINYTKKSLRPHGLGDFSVRGVFLHPPLGILERFDAENKTQLLETLHIYFQCQKSILDTANTMFTHRNTISYRLKKIQALLPLSLDEPEDMLMLQMAFQIRSIK